MALSRTARKTDSRRDVRYPVSGMLRILWNDSTGRERVSNAKVIDVSAAGLKLALDEAVPVRSYVTCNDELLGIRGTGSVRYCIFVRGRYELGLEFGGGTGWNQR
jgi:hypothetical protein